MWEERAWEKYPLDEDLELPIPPSEQAAASTPPNPGRNSEEFLTTFQTRKHFEDPDAHPVLNRCLFYGPSTAARIPGLNFKSQPPSSQLLLPLQSPIEIPVSSPASVSAMG